MHPWPEGGGCVDIEKRGIPDLDGFTDQRQPFEKALRSKRASRAGIAAVLKYGGPFLAARARRGLEAKFVRMALEHDPSVAANPVRLAELAAVFRKRHFNKMTLASLEARKKKTSRQPAMRPAGPTPAPRTSDEVPRLLGDGTGANVVAASPDFVLAFRIPVPAAFALV